jgi:hypothetical protein
MDYTKLLGAGGTTQADIRFTLSQSAELVWPVAVLVMF